MEYENIKKLIEDIGNSKLSSISIDFPDGTKISMTKETTQKDEKNVGATIGRPQGNIGNETSVVSRSDVGADESRRPEIETQNENIKVVTSPMVGTFYSKPSPKDKTYVEVGKQVTVGDTLCIIEAMKLMNEIESEYTGKIVKILVEDGKAVEYGTPLFEIEV